MQPTLVLSLALASLPRFAQAQGPLAPCARNSPDFPNLLQNPSFEDAPPASGWEVYGMQEQNLKLTTFAPHQLVIPGTTLMSVNEAGTAIGPQIYQNVAVTAGHNYFLQYDWKVNVLDTNWNGFKHCTGYLMADNNVLGSTPYQFHADSDDLATTMKGEIQAPKGTSDLAFRILIACNEPDDTFEVWVDNANMRRLGATEACNTLPAETTFTSSQPHWQTVPPTHSTLATPTIATPVSTSAASSSASAASSSDVSSAAATATVTVTAPVVTVTTSSTAFVTVTSVATVTSFVPVTTTATTTEVVTTTTTTVAGGNVSFKKRGCKPKMTSAYPGTTLSTVMITGSSSSYVSATITSTDSATTSPSATITTASSTSEPVTTTITETVTPTTTVDGGVSTSTVTATSTTTVTGTTTAATATVTDSATLTSTVTAAASTV